MRELTPATSFGFLVIEFAAEVLGTPLDPWEEWLVIHAGELLPDGRPRFRKVLTLVGRQNGKTLVAVVLTLFWQFVEGVPLILGTSTKLDYAKESWVKATRLAESTAEFDEKRPARWKREANGEQESWTFQVGDAYQGAADAQQGARYKIAAANGDAGRSLTVYRVILDELRQHHSYDAWDAAYPAMNAVRDAQVWALTNAGDVRSIVLNDLRDEALRYIDSGGAEGDYRLGLFEWSAEEDADPLDVHALAQANPNLGRRIDQEDLLAEAAAAVAKGGRKLTGFKTEVMCIHVKLHDPAIDQGAWRRCLEVGDLSGIRARVAVVIDVAPDLRHATLYAAAVLDDGRARVDPVRAWEGEGCTDQLRRDLPKLLARVKPRALGWLPNGPAAALAADLADRPGRAGWPPKGITVEEIRGEAAAVCMGFAEQVMSGRVVHSDDPLLNAHVGGAQWLKRGDAKVFSRLGEGHVDALYAAAGAVHLARTLPAPVGKPRLIVAP